MMARQLELPHVSQKGDGGMAEGLYSTESTLQFLVSK